MLLIVGNLDALLPLAAGGGGGGGLNLPNVLDVISAGDVDDEAMVELAIALSLQEQQGGGAGHGGLEENLAQV